MIEMLGVLTIIGVLSIGGLYAYRQAIIRYQTNQVRSLISYLRFALTDEEEAASKTAKQLMLNVCAQNPSICSGKINEYGMFQTVSDVQWRIDITPLGQTYSGTKRIFLKNLPRQVCRGLVFSNWDGLDYMWINDHSASPNNNYSASRCDYDYTYNTNEGTAAMYFYFAK